MPKREFSSKNRLVDPDLSESVVEGAHLKVTTEKKILTLRLFCSSLLLIHLRACCCGSMHIGKRDARVVRMPFWMDNSSGGSPSEVHLRCANTAAGVNHSPAQ